METAILALAILAGPPPEVTVAGPWQVAVSAGRIGDAQAVAPVTLAVEPPERVVVRDEEHHPLPFFNPQQPPWNRGARLSGVITQETTARFALVPDTLRVKSGLGDAPAYRAERDYGVLLDWGCLGRVEGSTIPEQAPVWVDYEYGLCRLDTISVDAQGTVHLRRGEPHVNVPQPPVLPAGERPLANLWLPARLAALGPANLFAITETAYPEPPRAEPSVMERCCPKTLAKLRAGEAVRILAWGDSVTVGTFAGAENRWQVQFAERLAERFPRASIEVIHHGWGGRNSQSFVNEPEGSEYHYAGTVVGAGADLIVSEFVNDAGFTAEQVETIYGGYLADFTAAGAEWVILTPHYVRPDWMGLESERDCDDDPRPYVAALREFAARHGVALADASLRWGRLYRQGIPYTTLLLNAINHPDARGMKLFADALMALMPE